MMAHQLQVCVVNSSLPRRCRNIRRMLDEEADAHRSAVKTAIACVGGLGIVGCSLLATKGKLLSWISVVGGGALIPLGYVVYRCKRLAGTYRFETERLDTSGAWQSFRDLALPAIRIDAQPGGTKAEQLLCLMKSGPQHLLKGVVGMGFSVDDLVDTSRELHANGDITEAEDVFRWLAANLDHLARQGDWP